MKALKFAFVLIFGVLCLNASEVQNRLQSACDNGDMMSCKDLGIVYDISKIGVEKNASKALEYYIKACNGGEKSACSLAGGLYHRNFDDLQNAQNYLTKACDMGEFHACDELGGILLSKQDKQKALEFFTKSCKLGSNLACIWRNDLQKSAL
ncbi:MAG: sel1 repeat family protein [Campylobacter sp.]|nr:sel1 repeat family protein [Campylobacter sp.]